MRNKETTGKNQTDITNSSQKYSHMFGASTDIVNTGTIPAITFRPYKCDTWPFTNNYDGTIRVHAEVSHYIYGLGEQ